VAKYDFLLVFFSDLSSYMPLNTHTGRSQCEGMVIGDQWHL